MKRFTESRFFCLMAETSPNCDRNELQVAYSDFAESIDFENLAESGLLFLHNQLLYTRIELAELNELGKKCLNPFSHLPQKIAVSAR